LAFLFVRYWVRLPLNVRATAACVSAAEAQAKRTPAAVWPMFGDVVRTAGASEGVEKVNAFRRMQVAARLGVLVRQVLGQVAAERAGDGSLRLGGRGGGRQSGPRLRSKPSRTCTVLPNPSTTRRSRRSRPRSPSPSSGRRGGTVLVLARLDKEPQELGRLGLQLRLERGRRLEALAHLHRAAQSVDDASLAPLAAQIAVALVKARGGTVLVLARLDKEPQELGRLGLQLRLERGRRRADARNR
jgi:hypothetical protein